MYHSDPPPIPPTPPPHSTHPTPHYDLNFLRQKWQLSVVNGFPTPNPQILLLQTPRQGVFAYLFMCPPFCLWFPIVPYPRVVVQNIHGLSVTHLLSLLANKKLLPEPLFELYGPCSMYATADRDTVCHFDSWAMSCSTWEHDDVVVTCIGWWPWHLRSQATRNAAWDLTMLDRPLRSFTSDVAANSCLLSLISCSCMTLAAHKLVSCSCNSNVLFSLPSATCCPLSHATSASRTAMSVNSSSVVMYSVFSVRELGNGFLSPSPLANLMVEGLLSDGSDTASPNWGTSELIILLLHCKLFPQIPTHPRDQTRPRSG